MPNQETLRLSLGDVEVPVELVTALVRRHLLRSLRVAANGHAPSPTPDPEEPVAPAPASTDGAGAP